jgi:hypothetical protein
MKSIIKYTLLTGIIVFLWACSSVVPEKPVIERETFINIMTEIHLTEASVMYANPFEKGRTLTVMMEYDKIFDKYKVSREDFMQTFNYYKKHPKEMDELYNDISERMTVKEAELSNQVSSQLDKDNTNDSINKQQ